VQGCVEIFEDKASGASKERPNLARALGRAGQGDTLLVVRIDRLARSLSHLLEIVETLRGKGAYFRSIHDPIDTSSAQGMLMTQMLGAFAEFERALIRERTRAGIKAAVARGAKPGNPRLRPHLPWALVLRQVLAITPPVRSFSERTLVKACRNLVRASVANPAILQKSPRLPPDTRVARLVADRLNTHPDATLRDIATWLSRDLREPTPRDGLCWTPESVRRVISQARALHLVA